MEETTQNNAVEETEKIEQFDPQEAKEPYVIPTVGRMVYYKSYGTPGGEFPSVNRSANITDVREVIIDEHGFIHPLIDAPMENIKGVLSHQVRLAVLNPDGLFFSGWLNQGEKPGQWDWMPYQKGQAKKTEELEKEIKK